MAAFYCDEDVTLALVPLLRERGHSATDTDTEGRKGAPDSHQVLYAAERGWTFLTHNRDDYRLLHDAWLLWSYRWGVMPRHSGILILSQRTGAAINVELVHTLVYDPDVRIANSLYDWIPTRGWQRFPR